MANGKVFDIDMTIPGIFKPSDPITRENEIKIERAAASNSSNHSDFVVSFRIESSLAVYNLK